MLADWERSGETLEAFARGHGLVPQRLAWWKKRLCAARPEPRSAVTFIPAAVIDAVPAPTVTPGAVIRLSHGIAIEIEGASPAWVAALARELARSPS
ncbi:MAG TPA: hypothetical protein VFP84_34670 [Kofleriaceae bacterium]|nr:hypothetical protein [Kofleriaceae bacterium]